ncbi:unnamed protein product [Urochloa humidicola]
MYGAPHGAWSRRPAGVAHRILAWAAVSQLTVRRRALPVAPCPSTKHLLRTGSGSEARPSGRKPVGSELAAEAKQWWAVGGGEAAAGVATWCGAKEEGYLVVMAMDASSSLPSSSSPGEWRPDTVCRRSNSLLQWPWSWT